MHQQTDSLTWASSKDGAAGALLIDAAVPTGAAISHTPCSHLARVYCLTMEIAAAATAVLIEVPGTMLLSDVLTSTATTKHLPTGSTF